MEEDGMLLVVMAIQSHGPAQNKKLDASSPHCAWWHTQLEVATILTFFGGSRY